MKYKKQIFIGAPLILTFTLYDLIYLRSFDNIHVKILIAIYSFFAIFFIVTAIIYLRFKLKPNYLIITFFEDSIKGQRDEKHEELGFYENIDVLSKASLTKTLERIMSSLMNGIAIRPVVIVKSVRVLSKDERELIQGILMDAQALSVQFYN